MATLQDQLNEVKQDQAYLKEKYARYIKLKGRLFYSEIIAGFISFGLVLGTCIWTYYMINNPDLDGGIFVLYFYVGLFLFTFLKEYLAQPVSYFFHKYFKISRSELKAFEVKREALSEKQWKIEQEIRKEIKRDQFSQENKFITKLDNLVAAVTNKKIPYNAAVEQNKLLEKEHDEIRHNGYQIHTRIFYNNRFEKIREAINNYSDPPPPFSEKQIEKSQINNNKTNAQTVKPGEKKTITVNNTTNFVPPPNDLKPNIPVEKQVEKNKGFEISKVTEEKKTSITENIPTSEIKIIPTTRKTIATITSKENPTPKEEEKTLSELFGMSNTGVAKQESTKIYQPKHPVKIDFPKLNEHRHNIGELGELYIFEKEQNHLINQGKINQSKEVIHVSLKSDSEGYDIISFNDTGEKKYIEVKTTTGNEFEPFYLSNSEMEAMKQLTNYWIYRVYNFNVDLKKGDLYKIDCKNDLASYYNIQASSFKVTPKR